MFNSFIIWMGDLLPHPKKTYQIYPLYLIMNQNSSHINWFSWTKAVTVNWPTYRDTKENIYVFPQMFSRVHFKVYLLSISSSDMITKSNPRVRSWAKKTNVGLKSEVLETARPHKNNKRKAMKAVSIAITQSSQLVILTDTPLWHHCMQILKLESSFRLPKWSRLCTIVEVFLHRNQMPIWTQNSGDE